MQTFSRPQQQRADFSTTSGARGSGPAAPQSYAGHSPGSRPTAPTSAPAQPQGGTTVAQALQARQALATLTETHGLAGEAVSLLRDLTQPPGEGPSRIDEMLAALTAITESQQRLEAQMERIARMLPTRCA